MAANRHEETEAGLPAVAAIAAYRRKIMSLQSHPDDHLNMAAIGHAFMRREVALPGINTVIGSDPPLAIIFDAITTAINRFDQVPNVRFWSDFYDSIYLVSRPLPGSAVQAFYKAGALDAGAFLSSEDPWRQGAVTQILATYDTRTFRGRCLLQAVGEQIRSH